jgi:hypothetical protein
MNKYIDTSCIVKYFKDVFGLLSICAAIFVLYYLINNPSNFFIRQLHHDLISRRLKTKHFCDFTGKKWKWKSLNSMGEEFL